RSGPSIISASSCSRRATAWAPACGSSSPARTSASSPASRPKAASPPPTTPPEDHPRHPSATALMASPSNPAVSRSGLRRDAVEPERVALVPVRAAAADVLAVDLRPVPDHVHQRHPVAPAEIVVRLEPRQDLARLHAGTVKALRSGQLHDLPRRQARSGFHRIEISLKRHPASPRPRRRQGPLPEFDTVGPARRSRTGARPPLPTAPP